MNIPIAMLHHISDAPHSSLRPWNIFHQQFIDLLDCILEKGLTTVTFADLEKGESSKKRVIITFDDCPASLFDFAIPELVKRNMKAVFYIPTSHIGGYNVWDTEELNLVEVKLMTAAQLTELKQMGMEIGSHGEEHQRLNTVDAEDAFKEIIRSKNILEELLNEPVYSFAHPYAEIPKGYKQMLRRAGYTAAVSIYQSVQNQYALRRFGIHESDNKKSISFKLTPLYLRMRQLYDPFLQIQKAIKKRINYLRFKQGNLPFLFFFIYNVSCF